MDLRQLEYFVAVAEERSFTRAAATVYASQPAVSARIGQLERELRQPLLDRSGRTVRLTDVGAAVLPSARAALAAVAELRQIVDEHAGLLRGKVAVGMVASSALSFDLPELLACFHRDHPAVTITLTEAASDHLLASLRDGTLDVAVIASPAAAPPGIVTAVVADEPLVAAVGLDHALAARGAIAIGELGDQPLIAFHRSIDARATVDAACAAAGFEAHVAFEASDPAVLAELAARGLGVAILPAPIAAAHAERLRILALVDPPLRASIALAWRAGEARGPAARALVDRLHDALPGAAADEPVPAGPAAISRPSS